MIRYWLISTLLFVFLHFTSGQQSKSDTLSSDVVYSDGALENLLTGTNKEGLNMIHDARLDSLFLLQKEVNLKINGVPGYRVQMYRGNLQGESKKRAREIQGMVLSKYPQLDVDVFYDPPVWRVQIGKFRSQNDAMKTQRMLVEAFREMESEISVIPTIISFPEIGD